MNILFPAAVSGFVQCRKVHVAVKQRPACVKNDLTGQIFLSDISHR